MLATVHQVTGVPLRAILGLEVVTLMAMPLAPVYVAVAAWLMLKGFEERQPDNHDPIPKSEADP
jgi:hypothetical protein